MLRQDKTVSFIKLSNNIIWNRSPETKDKTLIQKAAEVLEDSSIVSMIPEILAQLNWRNTRQNTCNFTLTGLITSCGYTPKAGIGKSISKFREVLSFLQDFNYIKPLPNEKDTDFEGIATNVEVTCIIDNNFKKKSGEDTEFFTIDLDSYNTIFNVSTSSALRKNLLNIYFYLSARLPSSVTKENINDGLLHFCYIGQGELATVLNISRSTVLTCLKILEDLKLIYFGNIGTVVGLNRKGETGVVFAKTVYAKTAEGFEQGLSYSKSYYTNAGYSTLELDQLKRKAKTKKSKEGKK